MITARILDLDDRVIKKEFDRIKVDKRGIDIMLPKSMFYVLKLEGLTSVCANVIKQQMLSNGGEVAVSRGAIDSSAKKSDCVIMGTLKQFQELIRKLKVQPWGLREVSEKIKDVLDKTLQKTFDIKWGNFRLKFGRKTRIMGILNVTPDSFSDGGKFFQLDNSLMQAERLEQDGADIIDIGGESSRPGAKSVSVNEELKRVIPVIKKIRKKIKIPISIDTRKSEVAKEAIEHGANIINDISGMNYDANMVNVAKNNNVPVILMHMKGNPSTMQVEPGYKDVVSEIYDYFEKTIKRAVKNGIDYKKIIIDPGIGFGKRLEDNVEILKRLREFRSLGCPVLVGPSRKSFIGEILKNSTNERLNGSLASCACAIMNGADIVRVHDVLEVHELVKIVDSIIR
ncbi:MAG: dihydropteroate synthase [Candidatus Saelkia tenebricola]|nr:dihydropteroate synthase [Candidatus Saelkia tenebricola]